ncbi:septal ring lytic transglycosylase RlpA family protein [Trinickia violacea]|uniref:Endolytic peptidoglycan transglycosylase RlpA n=1 Tax=Trinickia violacea TaxID=2571746 RepID=A0A4P8IUR2_9BURK|nr:septal ring lytic transglycosylase RlpA family protein [Trinickia violacea]QCP51595.1 septal ring lytic transglycosylase RlpA family protein [Trinickia violacea]
MKSRLPRLGSLLAFFALAGCAVPHGPADQANASPMRTQGALANAASAPLGYDALGKPTAADSKASLADAKPLEAGPDVSDFHQSGRASWYGMKFHGRKTASGERYDMNALTAAHKTLPLASYVRVTNTTNNKSVVVKINDRGPYVRGRIIDVSYAAARLLGLRKAGTASVKIEGLSQQEAKTEQAEMLADNSLNK